MPDEPKLLGDLNLPLPNASGRQTAHEFVRETLRHAILNGDLPGGTRLVQAELAEKLDVSTTPVREALRDLAATGLIQFDPHRGGVVSEVAPRELEEIYDIRMLLEVHAMRLAAKNLNQDTIDRARAIHEKMLVVSDFADWVMLNRDFHLTIYEAADSPRLLEILQGLLDTSTMYVSAAWQAVPRIREQATLDHADILEKLVAGDADGAVKAIESHMAIPRSVLKLDE